MISQILDLYKTADFDFRVFSYAEDELAYLFDEWVPYYRMKYSICKGINPDSILEVGVRYGYSAIAFLKAVSSAKYIGIDNDSDTFGGAKGALSWAKHITQSYNADFIIENTQNMDKFPGEHWDLIHIDGQQDGDGTFHDLELAIRKATWILVDGYFWSDENMLASTHFIKKYSQFIEYALIIPGYAGDLLIKVKHSPRSRGNSYIPLSSEYDKEYFEHDCGGYISFKHNHGRRLEDSRLIAPFLLAEPKPGIKILDIGCGRGELCYALAQKGADVTGIDYSQDAIDIAKTTFAGDSIAGSLSFVCEDAIDYAFENSFDVIIATDFLEHVEHPVLERILQRCAENLSADGKLILHTAPNLLYYQEYYSELRLKAKEYGFYLPPNPRSYYEDIMHINEQTPDSIKHLLHDIFDNFEIWVVPDGDMIGSLREGYTDEMIASSRGIFAVASHSSFSKDSIISLLTQKPLDKRKVAVDIQICSQITDMVVGKTYHIDVLIQNNGDERLASLQPCPVHISYHWRDKNGNTVVYDGVRSFLPFSLEPKESQMLKMTVNSPKGAGLYILEVTIVQESCFWFEECISGLPVCMECTVRSEDS